MAMLNNQRVKDFFSRSRWWDYIRFWVWEVSSINLMRFALKIVTYTSRCSSQIVEGPLFSSMLWIPTIHLGIPWPSSSELHIFFKAISSRVPTIVCFFLCVTFIFGRQTETSEWTDDCTEEGCWFSSWLNDVLLKKHKVYICFTHGFMNHSR